MKLIKIAFIALLSSLSLSAFAQSYPFDNQLVFSQMHNGRALEYPKVSLMIGENDYLGARVVMEEDGGTQYMLCDFENNKYLILMRQFGQKIAIESPVDPSTVDVYGINSVKAVENKKIKKEILGTKCRVYEGEKDGQRVYIYIGKLSVPAKGIENLTKVMTKEVGIDLSDGEMLLGFSFIDEAKNQRMDVEATQIINKKYTLSTAGYTKMSTSGFGF
ncbi:hypothetical protein [Flammeovirga sp. SJP92]|uniref:hypothetical protein n=1 Tax=Flammeovirga sp. SJP92 TaxID=1775430 RepID=UPI00078953BE|nr:hypothetical protein [Flammeovirga sp. SJP92]KXX71786.1 hypothetical protein AVL50_03100 [Flammeovirga sp. SJP92]